MKDESISAVGSPNTCESAPSHEDAPTQGKIGFVGLGHMGTAMAANLAMTAHQVTAYVRRPGQMGTLIGLGLRPTVEFADLFDCEVVISSCRMTPPFATSSSGEKTPASRVSHPD